MNGATIANNPTAQAYDRLQRSINWTTATTESRINVMEIMRQLLIQVPSHTPIFTYGEGFPYRSAGEQSDTVIQRLHGLRRKYMQEVTAVE